MLNLLLPVAGFIEKLGPVEHEERLSLLKASFGIPSEPVCDHDFDYLPECTRDQRHVGDRVWHPYYHMSTLLESRFISTSQTYTHGDIIQCVTLSIIYFLVMHCHFASTDLSMCFFILADLISYITTMRLFGWHISARLDLFPVTKYYSFYQPSTIHSTSRTPLILFCIFSIILMYYPYHL
jgi:hypothetical protein